VILADTHAWFWWLTQDARLSAQAMAALNREPVGISPMTMWELSMLAERQRVFIDAKPLQWIEDALERTETRIIPISPRIAVVAGGFASPYLRDPADRIIVATALTHGVPLVTKDDRIRRAAVVETVW